MKNESVEEQMALAEARFMETVEGYDRDKFAQLYW